MTARKPVGRPDTFKPEFVVQAQKLASLGATDKEIADFFEITERTFYRWQITHPEFCQALRLGKEPSDERVQRSFYHRAIGYTYQSEKVFQHNGKIVRAPITEHVPPDTTAGFIWLKNRRGWRDRQEVEVGGVGDFERMSDAELREFVASGAARQGAGDTDAASPRGKGASPRARRLS